MSVVFVYGSLKRGLGNAYLLNGAEYMGEAVTHPEFTMYSLNWFPGVRKEGNTPIHGELYRVNRTTFDSLDALEGYPDFYTREKIDIPGRVEQPWIYLIHPEYLSGDEGVVESGIWE